MTRLSHRRILMLLILTPVLLLIELAIGMAVFGGIRQINEDQARSTVIENFIRTNTKYVSLAESAQRGYLLTGDQRYKDSFQVYQSAAARNSAHYDTLPVHEKRAAIENILAISQRKFSEMAQTIRYYDAGDKDAALAMVAAGSGKLMMDSIRQTSSAIRTDIGSQIAGEQRHEDRLFMYFFGLIGILIVLSMAIVYYTYMKFASYTTQLELMVNSLEEANSRMTAYTNMSYHELKTPLRNIHGFAQLLKVRHIDEIANPEQDEFIRHITDGVRQMHRTIDDMRERYLSNP